MPYCPNCGTSVADTARICSNCNYPLTPLQGQQPEQPQQQPPAQQPPTPGQQYTTPPFSGQATGGAPQYSPSPVYVAGPPNDGQATAALILGILGVVLCPLILSIPAIIIGRQSQRRIEMSSGALGGLGMAKAGWILGIIGTAFGVIPVLIILFAVILGAAGAGSGGF